ncbi:uncharacterized protein JCM15063_002819, partial [Sporobolomyces koalae]|uniref:uncharacterized protein n=1 Tax=Sporobolomyces koalae TaxID=500713 RepID=UPI00317F73D2
MHVDNPDRIPAVRICPARHQKLLKAVEVVSKVLEGFVKEVPSSSTQRDKPKERFFTELEGYLEEFAGEIARQIFAIPFARVLPTGRFTVTLLGDLRVDVIDPLKLTTKGRATLAKMNLSPQLGWKTLVPKILSHTSSGLTERLPWLTCTHIVEILTTPQQPPPNNNVARRVARMNVARSNTPRNLAPLFELVNHASSDQTTGSTGADTIRTPSRLDWTCKSGVVGRKDGPPRLDQGVAYDDFRFLSEDAPESALRTRNQLEFA